MKRLAITLLSLVSLYACTQVEPDNSGGAFITGDVASLTLNFGMSKAPTKSSAFWTADDSAIHDVNLYVFRDGVVEESKYMEAGSATVSVLIDGKPICFYVLANMGQAMDCTGYTKSQLQALSVSIYDLNQPGHAYFPAAGCSSEFSSFSSANITINLNRLVSRVTFKVDRTNLRDFDLNYVQLLNTPVHLTPFSTNVAVEGDMDVVGDYASESDMTALNNGGSVSFFVPENVQGVLLPSNTDPWAKVPDSIPDKQNVCSYLEMGGSFNSGSVFSGQTIYRFYLGADNIRDFSVVRNTDYVVTLVLSADFQKTTWKVESTASMNDGLITVGTISGLHEVDNLYLGEIVRMGVNIDQSLVDYIGGDSVLRQTGRFRLLFSSQDPVTDWNGAVSWMATQDDLEPSDEPGYNYMVDFHCLKPVDGSDGNISLYLYDTISGVKYYAGSRSVSPSPVTIRKPYLFAGSSPVFESGSQSFPIIFPSKDRESAVTPTNIYLFMTDSDGNLLTAPAAYGFTYEPFASEYPVTAAVDLSSRTRDNINNPIYTGHSYSVATGKNFIREAVTLNISGRTPSLNNDAVAVLTVTPSVVTTVDLADVLSYAYRVDGLPVGSNEGLELLFSSNGLDHAPSAYLDPTTEPGVVFEALDLYSLQSPVPDNAGNKVYFGTRYCPFSLLCLCNTVGFREDIYSYYSNADNYDSSNFSLVYWCRNLSTSHMVDYIWGRSYKCLLNPVSASMLGDRTRYVEAAAIGTKQLRETQPCPEESDLYYGKNVHIQAYALSGAYFAPDSYENNYNFWDATLPESVNHASADFWKRDLKSEAIVFEDTHTDSNYRLDSWVPLKPSDLESIDNPSILEFDISSGALAVNATKQLSLSFKIIFHGSLKWHYNSNYKNTVEVHTWTALTRTNISVGPSSVTLASRQDLLDAFTSFNRIWRQSCDNSIATGDYMVSNNCIPDRFTVEITDASNSDGSACSFLVAYFPTTWPETVKYAKNTVKGYLYNDDETSNVDGTSHCTYSPKPGGYVSHTDSNYIEYGTMSSLPIYLDCSNLNVYYRYNNY